MRAVLVCLLPLLGTVAAALQPLQLQQHDLRPNIVLMVVDDLGYGDLGCYGNDTIESPNIDALAGQGARFTQMYSAAPICTPSRAAILTGKYPIRTGMCSDQTKFRTLNSPAQPGGLPTNETTLPALARLRPGNAVPFRTAAVGKWHLGTAKAHLPTQFFGEFFGMPVTNVQTCATNDDRAVYDLVGGHGTILRRSYLPYYWTLTSNIWLSALAGWVVIAAFARGRVSAQLLLAILAAFLLGAWYARAFTLLGRSSCLLYRGEEVVQQPVHLDNLTVLNTNEARSFMERAVQDQQPFFLYLSYVKVHTALFTTPAFANRSRHGAYGDNIAELDWSVGEVMRTLEELGVANDTLVMFTSDNGPFLERGLEAGYCGRGPSAAGSLAGPLKGAKGQTWECGIRVPFLARWPGRVAAGAVVHNVASLLDLYPTVAEVLGVRDALVPAAENVVRAVEAGEAGTRPVMQGVDGVSLLRLLPDARHSEAADLAAVDPRALPATAPDAARPFLFHYCGCTVTAVRHGRLKAHYFTPNWDAGLSACPSLTICPCKGTQHDPPLLYDLDVDPAEQQPLDVTLPEHLQVVAAMQAAVAAQAAGVQRVPNQLENLPRPWLMPCCNPGGKHPWWLQLKRVLTGTCTC